MTNKELQNKKENIQIRNVFLIGSVIYWLGYFLIAIDNNITVGDAYITYVLIVGAVTGFGAMIIKTP